jgi:hypothetical protein
MQNAGTVRAWHSIQLNSCPLALHAHTHISKEKGGRVHPKPYTRHHIIKANRQYVRALGKSRPGLALDPVSRDSPSIDPACSGVPSSATTDLSNAGPLMETFRRAPEKLRKMSHFWGVLQQIPIIFRQGRAAGMRSRAAAPESDGKATKFPLLCRVF